MLGVMLSLSCSFAEDNATAGEVIPEGNLSVDEAPSADEEIPSNDNVSVEFESKDTTVVKGKYFSVTVRDENGTAIENGTVHFDINGKSSQASTSSQGVAKLLVSEKEGTYAVRYTFNETGYAPKTDSSKILVVSKGVSKIKASSYTAYYGFKNQVAAVLSVDGVALHSRNVKLTINKKTYTAKTNSKGKVYFPIGLKIGKYNAKFTYSGEKNIKSSTSKIVVTVKKMTAQFKKANSVIYRHKTADKLKVQLLNARGNPVSGKTVKITYGKKTVTEKTDKNGIITLTVKLSKGPYKFKYYAASTKYYQKASKTFAIHVKSKSVRNNGIWLLSTDMKTVDLNQLHKYNTKHIFLNAKAVERYGKSAVESFIKNATSHGMKTHLWMQVFYKSGKWINPIKKNKINYTLLNSKVKEAKSYAKVKGVAGVHFDYIRFPGNAHKYKYSTKAVNYFVKKASGEIKKINSKIIVSAAVMPEPSSCKHYYAQDITTMSKHFDVIIPMVYKGNYRAGSDWIKKVTSKFVKMSKGAQIWTGLQSYKSDSNVKRLSSSALISDSDYAGFGGATGVILFRHGLINYFNFSRV